MEMPINAKKKLDFFTIDFHAIHKFMLFWSVLIDIYSMSGMILLINLSGCPAWGRHPLYKSGPCFSFLFGGQALSFCKVARDNHDCTNSYRYINTFGLNVTYKGT